jgi:hypothetical protein
MGAAGDLVLIFADALVRSWKQITKFKPIGAAAPRSASPSASQFAALPSRSALSSSGNGTGAASAAAAAAAAQTRPAHTAGHRDRDHGPATASESAPEFNPEGLIRDERGIRMAKESDD